MFTPVNALKVPVLVINPEGALREMLEAVMFVVVKAPPLLVNAIAEVLLMVSDVTAISPLAVKLKGALSPSVAPKFAFPVWLMYTAEVQPEPIANVVMPDPGAWVFKGATAVPIDP